MDGRSAVRHSALKSCAQLVRTLERQELDRVFTRRDSLLRLPEDYRLPGPLTDRRTSTRSHALAYALASGLAAFTDRQENRLHVNRTGLKGWLAENLAEHEEATARNLSELASLVAGASPAYLIGLILLIRRDPAFDGTSLTGPVMRQVIAGAYPGIPATPVH